MIQIRDNREPLLEPVPEGRMALVGLGGAGVNILDQLALHFQRSIRLLALDTCRQVIAGSVVTDKFLLGANTCRGLGCGGDPSYAASLLPADLPALDTRLAGVEEVILVVGLGGGTGSGMAPDLLSHLRARGLRTVTLAVSPFSFEATRRLDTARHTVNGLRENADAVLVLSNDRLTRHLGLDHAVHETFRLMNRVVGQAAVGLSHLLGSRALMQLSLADLQTLVGRSFHPEGTLENCWIGMAAGRGPERHREVVESALASPLFSDAQVWREGERMLVSVMGGRDFSMAELQKVQTLLQAQLPRPLPFVAGAAIDPSQHGVLQITVLVGKSDPVPESALPIPPVPHPASRSSAPISSVNAPPPAGPAPGTAATVPAETRVERGRSRKPQRYFVEQEELPLETSSYRGRFENSLRSESGGQDLDQPTFQRLRIRLRP
ncbi:MAG: hypothetical protein OHK005_17220 [Candidatus Methylacidiphilales bacterium]